MKVHIFSRELEVLEYSNDELPGPEEIGARVREDLARMGLEPWPCVEVEAFTYNTGTLIFATPARLFVPSRFSAALGDA